MNPVTFNISVGAVPENFEGNLQETLQLFASRLIVAPSVPWSSFTVGAAQPSSNLGPWFKDGEELRVWSDALATYIPVRVDGSGILPATLPLSAIENIPAQQVLISDISGRPSYVGGTPGQVLTVAPSGTPVFSNPPSGQLFTANMSNVFDYASSGTPLKVPFNAAYGPQAAAFNTTSNQFVIPADGAGYWFFFASLQIDDINAPSTDVVHNIFIARNGGLAGTIGAITAGPTVRPVNGVTACGLLGVTAGDTIEVQIASTSNNVTGNEFSVNNNGANTRFGGFRLI